MTISTSVYESRKFMQCMWSGLLYDKSQQLRDEAQSRLADGVVGGQLLLHTGQLHIIPAREYHKRWKIYAIPLPVSWTVQYNVYGIYNTITLELNSAVYIQVYIRIYMVCVYIHIYRQSVCELNLKRSYSRLCSRSRIQNIQSSRENA